MYAWDSWSIKPNGNHVLRPSWKFITIISLITQRCRGSFKVENIQSCQVDKRYKTLPHSAWSPSQAGTFLTTVTPESIQKLCKKSLTLWIHAVCIKPTKIPNNSILVEFMYCQVHQYIDFEGMAGYRTPLSYMLSTTLCRIWLWVRFLQNNS